MNKPVLLFILASISFTFACNNSNNSATLKTPNKVIDTCERKQFLSKSIDTDTITFDIGTKLYWSYNCDSVWLTYVNKSQKKIVIDNWTENPEFAIKMGLRYIQDFNKYLLFERNVISGCCDLPNSLIFDKETGKEVKNFGPKVWNSEDKKHPLLICFDVDESKEDKNSLAFDRLIIYNLNNNKVFYFALKEYTFFKDLNEKYLNYNRGLLNEFHLEKNMLTLRFEKETGNNTRQFVKQAIKLNLDAYGI